jgi:Outer membrane lipoprotein carrier protein LolA-like
MKRRVILLAALRCCLLLGLSGAAFAQAFGIALLQRLLQDAPQAAVRYTELRESRWLAAPIESSGTLRSTPTMLEKRVEQPRPETWRILDDRMQIGTPGAVGAREIMLDQAPAAAALAQTLRRVLAGDLQALNRDFRLELSGDERQWTVQLTPRQEDVARQLKRIDLHGAGSRLSDMVIVEAQGDRTTTRLIYAK